MSSPTQRSLKFLRDNGWTACVVEKWIAQIQQRKDAFGFGDILACSPDEGIILVQSTVGARHADHVKKALAIQALRTWLEAGGRFAIQSWAKQGSRGKRKTWRLREQWITIRDLPKRRRSVSTADAKSKRRRSPSQNSSSN